MSTLVLAQDVKLSDSQAREIGQRIWKNECAGTVDGLTAWNTGEDFASLGIGHFIWYPKDQRGPFEESFPGLVRFLVANRVDVPEWLQNTSDCPWNSRSEFMADFRSSKMKELRSMLTDTVPWQARYAAARLETALPKMLEAAPADERAKVKTNFYRVAERPLGMYALMDYVNFKGEGTSKTERYDGQGWGLLQVLAAMDGGPPMKAFSRAADSVLTRRVENSPASRNERKWLAGWRNRVGTYDN